MAHFARSQDNLKSIMNVCRSGWVCVCMSLCINAHRQTCAHFLHVGGLGGGCDFLGRSEKDSDFVDCVTFPCMYMSIVRYGLLCIG